MKKSLLVGILLFSFTNIFGQINKADSTVGIVGYWNLNEKQSYTIFKEKYKIKDADTTYTGQFKYTVDLTIIDSTADSYTIEWYYKDYETINDNSLVQSIFKISENLNILIKTNELGGFIEVVNWEEIRDSIFVATSLLREVFKDTPDIDEILKKIENNYLTKENIESGSIRDILQYYYFHGGLYKLGDVLEATIQLPNLYGGNPFEADVAIWLDEIKAEFHNSVLRSEQTVNSEQLTDATYLYLKDLRSPLDTIFPDRKDFAPLHNNTWAVSQIHESGWVLYAIETKETIIEQTINVENLIFEIQ